MYVLSNTTGVNGAMTILYEDILKQIAIQLKTEILYLLPSSVHEWIVLPGCDDVAFLKDLVEPLCKSSSRLCSKFCEAVCRDRKSVV